MKKLSSGKNRYKQGISHFDEIAGFVKKLVPKMGSTVSPNCRRKLVCSAWMSAGHSKKLQICFGEVKRDIFWCLPLPGRLPGKVKEKVRRWKNVHQKLPRLKKTVQKL